MALSGKKILVAGGSGFIGTNLIARLLRNNADVLNVDVSSNRFVKARTIQDDLLTSDFSFLEQERFDCVYHLVALSNPRMCEDIEKAFQVNVNLTVRLLNALKDNPPQKIVLLSSYTIYSEDVPQPLTEDTPLSYFHNNYTLTKALQEQAALYFAHTFSLPVLIFRVANIYGPYQEWRRFPNFLPQICLQALEEKKIEIWNPNPMRDWIFIDDAVDAMIAALDSDYTGVLNLGTGIGTSAGAIAETVAAHSGVSLTRLDKPVTGPMKAICDISRITKELNWNPQTSLEEGIKETYEFYKELMG